MRYIVYNIVLLVALMAGICPCSLTAAGGKAPFGKFNSVVSPDTLQQMLEQLDAHIERHHQYAQAREQHIDSIKVLLAKETATKGRLKRLQELGAAYTSFNTDSALYYYKIGSLEATSDAEKAGFRLRMAALFPLMGMSERAVNTFDSINPADLPVNLQRVYYECARQAYSYICSFYTDYPDVVRHYNTKAMEAQSRLLELLPNETALYKLNTGEYFFHKGEFAKAMAVLDDLLDSEPVRSNVRARAAHILSTMAREKGEKSLWEYYLIESAISDVSTATLEVTSLQDLGIMLYERGDVDRAYDYLTMALDNAVQCRAVMRTVQTASALPVIETAYTDKIQQWRTRIYMVIAVLGLMLITLGIFIIMLRRDMVRMRYLQHRLTNANSIKEVYISKFLSLCSIYMDKLTQLTKIIERKLSSGKSEELLRMSRSGKFVEEQSKEFYSVFDDAFLHLYPNFVSEVNKLLLPDQQIVLKPGEKLNTDLRILAFMRLGIDDSARISQVLNYSLNTIYTYRNKLKNKAIYRDTFEADIMRIPDIE